MKRLVLIIFLVGCEVTDVTSYGIYPTPTLLRNVPKSDDLFSQGFREGCYNFIGQNGEGFNRVYEIAKDPDLVNNPLYRQGYDMGDRYCGVFVNKDIIL